MRSKFVSHNSGIDVNDKRIFEDFYDHNTVQNVKPAIASPFSFSIIFIAPVEYFDANKDYLLQPCNDEHAYSHCQLYYLFRYNKQTGICEPFYRMPCMLLYFCYIVDIDKQVYTGVTIAVVSSYRLSNHVM
jgi:hypothetical protein